MIAGAEAARRHRLRRAHHDRARRTNPSYRDANKLANVVTPDEPQYAAVMRGKSVPPEPVNATPRKAGPAVTAPAWATRRRRAGPARRPAAERAERRRHSAGLVVGTGGRCRSPAHRRARLAQRLSMHDRGRVAGLRHPRGRAGDRQMARRTWKAHRPGRRAHAARTSRPWPRRRSAASSCWARIGSGASAGGERRTCPGSCSAEPLRDLPPRGAGLRLPPSAAPRGLPLPPLLLAALPGHRRGARHEDQRHDRQDRPRDAGA